MKYAVAQNERVARKTHKCDRGSASGGANSLMRNTRAIWKGMPMLILRK